MNRDEGVAFARRFSTDLLEGPRRSMRPVGGSILAGGMVRHARDGSTWRVGTDAEVAWIADGTSSAGPSPLPSRRSSRPTPRLLPSGRRAGRA